MDSDRLKEQREKAHEAAESRAAESRAAEAAASVESDDAAPQSKPSSSFPHKSRYKRSSEPASASPVAIETLASEGMTHQAATAEDDLHAQPLEDGSLPAPGLGSTDHQPPSSGQAFAQENAPMKPHNLLSATEIIQAGGDPLSPFTPAPILRLNAIRIAGAGRALRPGYLASLCRPYMDPTLSSQNPDASILSSLYYGSRTSHVLPGQPTTLPSILALTSSLAGDLDKLDVFRTIEATLVPSVFPGATEEDVDVILACGKPKGRVFLKSSTDVGNGEGSASVQGRIRNVFGGAETLQGSATFGTRTKQAFNLEFGGPFPGNPDTEYKWTAFSHDRDYSAFASVSEAVKGFRTSINSSFVDESKGDNNASAAEESERAATSQHEVAYEASLRQLGRVTSDASVAVRKMAAAPSVKSALSWTWISESRDNVVLPSRGRRVKTMVEYAGLGGDAKHVKAEMETSTGRHFSPLAWFFSSSSSSPHSTSPSPFVEQANNPSEPVDVSTLRRSLAYPIYSTLTLRSGLVHSLASTPTHFSDRFQLGGPTSLRMFRHSSLGPKSSFDTLGGDAYWSLGLSILSPIPTKPHWPLMLHTFFNAGQLCQLPLTPLHSTNWPTAFSELAQPSTSVGVGVVYMQGQLRVELNAGVPLTARIGDGVRKGLQLGIGIDFL